MGRHWVRTTSPNNREERVPSSVQPSSSVNTLIKYAFVWRKQQIIVSAPRYAIRTSQRVPGAAVPTRTHSHIHIHTFIYIRVVQVILW